MAQQTINVGTAPNDGTGDTLKTSFTKCNANFTELYGAGYAPLASPTFTGDPKAPTPTSSDNDTSIATTAFVKAQGYLSASVTATITVGYSFTAYNAGNIGTGSFTPAAANGNYQYYQNTGAHTISAPTTDCAIDILMTNGSGAGVITFSGFTVGGNIGDTLTTTLGNKFIIHIARINATSTYMIKALQ